MNKEDLIWDSYDIEAIAKKRINRAESKASNRWSIGAIIGLVAGWILHSQANFQIWSWVIIGISMVVFSYYWFYLIPKKQKVYANQLWTEYQNELRGK